MSVPREGVVAVLFALSAALAGCGEAPERHEVEIRNFVYGPASTVAKVGDTLVWTNRDLVPHTVTDVAGAWSSGPIAPGASWNLTLEAERGTVDYACIYHPTMTGSLVVE